MWNSDDETEGKKRQKRKYQRTIHAWQEKKTESVGSFQSLEVLTPQKRKYRRAIHYTQHVTPQKSKSFENDRTGLNESTSTSISDSELRQIPVSDSEFESSESEPDSDSENEPISDNGLASENEPDSELDSESSTESRCESDSSIQSDNQQKKSCSDKPLYEGCKLTEKFSFIMIMLFVMKHSLSTEAFNDLLHLISCHLPESATFANSVYRVKDSLKKSMDYQEPVKHFYCEVCQQYSTTDNVCNKDTCRSRNAKMLEFYDLKLEQQLKNLFKDDTFVNCVRQQAKTGKNRTMCSDIMDGQVYTDTKKKLQHGADIYLTFTMNTDGVSLFSSSRKGSLWPVYLAVNELPLKLRFSRKYLIVCCLHSQVEKPNMLTYLTPLMKILETLHSRGLVVDTQQGKLRVKGHLIAASLDLPAKAMVANMKQFNGKNACSVCFDPGEYPQGMPLLRYYPYNDSFEARTHQSFVDDTQEALQTREAVNGIKGASPLMLLSYTDLSKVFVIDWMHNVLLGVTKSLLNLWLNNSYRNSSFYIGDKITLLDQRYLNLQIPDFVSRRQRSLHDHSHWKASECREWLIHFSVPVLHGVLSNTVFFHYLLLTTAMVLLTKDDMNDEDINLAEGLLEGFCKVFPKIYGVQKQTMNVHLLRHLAQFTRLYGPLYSFSCFGFESMNCYLKSMVHGTRYIYSQVCFAVGMSKQLSTIVRQCLDDNTDTSVKQLANQLGSKIIVEDVLTSDECHILGKVKPLAANSPFYNVLPQEVQENSPKTFLRLQKGCHIYYCKQNNSAKTKNSYTVKFEQNNSECFGHILIFLIVDNKMSALVQVFQTEQFYFSEEEKKTITDPSLRCFLDQALCPHLFRVSSHQEISIISVKKLLSKCIFLDISPDKTYISSPPNFVEHG